MQTPTFKSLQSVTLVGDPGFLGDVVGQVVDRRGQPTGKVLVSITQPGKTGLQGDQSFNADQLVALSGMRPNSSPTLQSAGRAPDRRRVNQLHVAPTGVGS